MKENNIWTMEDLDSSLRKIPNIHVKLLTTNKTNLRGDKNPNLKNIACEHFTMDTIRLGEQADLWLHLDGEYIKVLKDRLGLLYKKK